jgi:hypothetical protein
MKEVKNLNAPKVGFLNHQVPVCISQQTSCVVQNIPFDWRIPSLATREGYEYMFSVFCMQKKRLSLGDCSLLRKQK